MLKTFLTGFLIGFCKMSSLKLRQKAALLAEQARQFEETAEQLELRERVQPSPRGLREL